MKVDEIAHALQPYYLWQRRRHVSWVTRQSQYDGVSMTFLWVLGLCWVILKRTEGTETFSRFEIVRKSGNYIIVFINQSYLEEGKNIRNWNVQFVKNDHHLYWSEQEKDEPLCDLAISTFWPNSDYRALFVLFLTITGRVALPDTDVYEASCFCQDATRIRPAPTNTQAEMNRLTRCWFYISQNNKYKTLMTVSRIQWAF